MTAPALLTETDAAKARVHHVVVPEGWSSGAYLLPGSLLLLVKGDAGLAVQLEPASAKSLAEQLVRLAEEKEPSQ